MIQIRNLSKIFVSRNGIQTLALDDVSLDLPSVGLVFVVGKSGSGKSTLLGLIGGMDKPSSGEILLGGASLGDYSQNQLDEYRNGRVGFIFQEYHLLENLTARENVNLALWLQGKKGDTEKIKQLFASLDIEGQEEKLIHEMSGGQKQRVAIARSLIKNPDIILTDEPTGALDSSTGKEILKTLKQISKDKLVIVVSHDLENAKEFADRIIELKDGKITSDKTLKSHDPTDKKQIQTSETTPSTPEIPETNEATPQSTTQTPKAVASPRKKYSLPLTKAFKLGFRGMFEHKFRLLAALFLSLFSLVTLGFFMSFLSFDKERVFIDSMYSREGNYLPIAGTNEDMQTLKDTFASHEFYPVYEVDRATADSNRFDELIANQSKMSFYLHPTIVGMMGINEEIAKELGFSLIGGRFPSKNDEVVISEFFFDYFKDLGYRDLSGNSVQIQTFNDLIGKQFGSKSMILKSGGYTIVGIISTDFDYDRYAILKEIDPSKDEVEASLDGYFSSRLECGAERLIYFCEDFFKTSSPAVAEFFAASLCRNYAEDRGLIGYIFDDKNQLKIASDTMLELDEASEILSSLSVIFLGAGMVVAVMAFVLLFNYFSATIVDEGVFIAKLQLLGASRKTIMKIYYVRTLLIGIFLALISPPLTIALQSMLTKILAKSFGIHLALFIYKPLSLLATTAFCLLTTSIASIIPIGLKTKKHPKPLLH